MDGTVVVRTGVPDVGGGQASSLCQIAAEVLGVDPERVSVHIADSALTPLAGTTTATRQLYMSGNAVLEAARQLRQQVLPVAAALLEASPAQVDLEGGDAVAPDGRRVALARVMQECARLGVPRSALGVYRAPAGDPVEFERVGGQIQGGAVMGLGYALLEEVVLDRGTNLTTSLASYLIPTAEDVPDVEPVILESGDGQGPFGARGIGEPPIGPPAAAVANAIEDAVGVRITELPMTPERVARALGLLG